MFRQIIQQPLSETPGTTLVRFTEPPSDVGTAGPQIAPPAPLADAAPADDAVVLAAFADAESEASPGSCSGVWELLDDEAPIESELLDRLAVPVPADPLAVEPVVPFVVVPVVAVLVPADDVDDVDAPVEVDVVLAPGVAVAMLSGAVAVVPLDVPVVVPCAVVEIVVWAWIAVVPSMSSAAVTVTARDGLCFI